MLWLQGRHNSFAPYGFVPVISKAIELVKVNFELVEFSERVEILLFAGENVTLKLNR